MKKMQCEVCGSTEIRKVSEDFFECQSCGIQYSKSEVQKLFVEITGKVKIDNTDQTKNLYILARNDVDNPDGNALKYYEAILLNEPTSWEANFFVGYLKAWDCKLGEMRSASSKYCRHIDSVLSLIKNTLEGEEMLNALETINLRSKKLYESLVGAANRKRDKAESKDPIVLKTGIEGWYEEQCERTNIKQKAKYEWYRDCLAIFLIYAEYGESLEKHFPSCQQAEEYKLLAWKTFVTEYGKIAVESEEPALLEIVDKYISKIKRYEPDYSAEEFSASLEENDNEKKSRKKKSAEDYIYMFGIFALTPYTFIGGILSLFFVNKAKTENGGELSKRAKRWLIISIVGFSAWMLFFIILFAA